MSRAYLPTPGLEPFEVAWAFEVENVPFENRDDGGEFLRERFMEDVLDALPVGVQPDFVIVETRMPTEWTSSTAEVVFHIVTNIAGAQELQKLEYEIHPLRDNHPDWDYRGHDGMTWGELQLHIRDLVSQGRVSANDIVAVTDDEDANAPWYILTGSVRGDKGMHLTAQEFRR